MFDDILGEKKKTKTVKVEYIGIPVEMWYPSEGYQYIPTIRYSAFSGEIFIPRELVEYRSTIEDVFLEHAFDLADETTRLCMLQKLIERIAPNVDLLFDYGCSTIISKEKLEINEMGQKLSAYVDNGGKHIQTINEAREFMFNEFINDPDWLRVYVDNIAMLLHDEQHWNIDSLDFKDKSTRDRIAANIMGLVFGDGAKPIKRKSPGVGVVEVDA